MAVYETKSHRFEVTDARVDISCIGKCKCGAMQVMRLDKREFGEALVGLGIVMSAVVRHSEPTDAVAQEAKDGRAVFPADIVRQREFLDSPSGGK